MSAPVISPPVAPPPARRRRRWPWLLVAAVWLVALLAAVLAGVNMSRQEPDFPSLAKSPDPSLHGTFAYVDDATSCIRIVAAAGSPSKEVYCLPEQDVGKAVKLGKEQGPQLVWRADGRLEVTMFRMTDPPGPYFNPGWQRLVDVRTGAVQELPSPPAQPDLTTHPTVNAGRTLGMSSNPENGKIKVTLTDSDGTRTLLSAQGPQKYSYGLRSAFWGPGGQYVVADDGRILIITTDDPPVTRVLTDATQQSGFGDDPRVARFAVTGKDLLR